MTALLQKYELLKNNLKRYDSLAVAFSSGVDSALLLKAAQDALGDRVLAVTAHSCSFPQWEFSESQTFCQQYGIRQLIVETNELQVEGFAENPSNRCYICKKALFRSMEAAAAAEGFSILAEGSNLDDLGDYRPGLQAIAELGIASPLREAGLTKAEIRQLSKHLGLPTWQKPSFACLASRFPYGERITAEKLCMVEQAEAYLMTLGFLQLRVRIHGTVARIEVLPEDLPRLMEPETRMAIHTQLKAYGFSYVAADLQGYRMGSMNEVLHKTIKNQD